MKTIQNVLFVRGLMEVQHHKAGKLQQKARFLAALFSKILTFLGSQDFSRQRIPRSIPTLITKNSLSCFPNQHLPAFPPACCLLSCVCAPLRAARLLQLTIHGHAGGMFQVSSGCVLDPFQVCSKFIPD